MPLIVTVKHDCWMSSDRLQWYWEITKIVSWDSLSSRDSNRVHHKYKSRALAQSRRTRCSTDTGRTRYCPFLNAQTPNCSVPSTSVHVRIGGYLQPEVSSGLPGTDSSSAGGRCGGSGRQKSSLPCRGTRQPLPCEILASRSCIDEEEGVWNLIFRLLVKRLWSIEIYKFII